MSCEASNVFLPRRRRMDSAVRHARVDGDVQGRGERERERPRGRVSNRRRAPRLTDCICKNTRVTHLFPVSEHITSLLLRSSTFNRSVGILRRPFGVERYMRHQSFFSEVTLHRARLVLGWATASMRNQPLRSTQPGRGQLSLAIPPWVGAMRSSVS